MTNTPAAVTTQNIPRQRITQDPSRVLARLTSNPRTHGGKNNWPILTVSPNDQPQLPRGDTLPGTTRSAYPTQLRPHQRHPTKQKPRRRQPLTQDNQTILLTALPGQAGNKSYYVTVITLEEAARTIHIPEDSGPGDDDTRDQDIQTTTHLLMQEHPVTINPILVAVRDGHPTWHPIHVTSHGPNILDLPPIQERRTPGFLELDQTRKFLAIRNLHQLKAVRNALEQLRQNNPQAHRRLAEQEVPVILVSAASTDSHSG